MKVNNSIFKSYDIRGIYPEELNEDAVFLIGKAFVKCTGAKIIVVGQDMRLSSPDLFNALCHGIIDTGCNVVDLGQIPTEMLYFAVGQYSYDAGIMITASHNPKEYNGLKLIKKNDKGFSMIRGKDLLEVVSNQDETVKGAIAGVIEERDIREDYISYISSFVNLKGIKPFKIVIDAGNGMVVRTISLLKLPSVKIIPLNFSIDGSFPSHPSNPLEEGATEQVSALIRKEKADFGFIFDGDADRIFLLDEKGNLVLADTTLLLLAKYFLKSNPGAGVAYNTICSKSVPEFIKKWRGNPIKTQVGFVNVREGVIKGNGMMGGELSGHYCFKDNFYGDSGLMALLILTNVISNSKKKVSELVSELSLYTKSAELNFKIDNKDQILDKVKEKYSDGKQEYLDGVTVEYKNWWFNLRPSNTEPFLRLTIEADKKEVFEKKKEELVNYINSIK